MKKTLIAMLVTSAFVFSNATLAQEAKTAEANAQQATTTSSQAVVEKIDTYARASCGGSCGSNGAYQGKYAKHHGANTCGPQGCGGSSIAPLHRKGQSHYMLEALVGESEKYKKDITLIRELRDVLYSERNVLKALMQAQEPSAKDIRSQSKIVRQLHNKLKQTEYELHVKLMNDKDFAKYFQR